MAGALDAAYVALIVLVALAGTFGTVRLTPDVGPPTAERSSTLLAVAVGTFVIAAGASLVL